MCPYFFVFGRTVPAYSILGICAILTGWLFTVVHGVHLKKDRDDCTFLYMYGFLGAVAGAKLLPVLLNLPAAAAHLPELFTDPEAYAAAYLGGLVFYGGLAGGLAGVFLYCRRFHLHPEDFMTAFVPAIPLAHSIGRIGCFLAGCCYGKETSAWFGIVFTNSLEAPNGVPLIPTQLMESACDFLLFLILWRLSLRCVHPRRLLGLYLLLYGILRFLLEFLRGDDIRGFFGPLSTSQWLSLAGILIGSLLILSRGSTSAQPIRSSDTAEHSCR